MFKIGIGPSSSHTLGPWKAAMAFLKNLKLTGKEESVNGLQVELFGSLALTGEGHGTDMAILMGLSGYDPILTSKDDIANVMETVRQGNKLVIGGQHRIEFVLSRDLQFKKRELLPYHSNGMRFTAFDHHHFLILSETYYSIGGGFIVHDDEKGSAHNEEANSLFTFPIHSAKQLISYCEKEGLSIADVVLINEKSLKSEEDIRHELMQIWQVMLESVYRGCHRKGILPGGLNVKRRAPGMCLKLISECAYTEPESWLRCIRSKTYEFPEILDWISCFALAVNEENADYGRIVTAPTNGSAGVLPAVLLYAICFDKRDIREDQIVEFLMVASEVGSLFKKGATISAAAGGCQAEIGVSSAMAAAGLTHLRGGSAQQCLVASEIAMEHHLGLTCDPVKGLVQIPCIERNSLGAIKAIAAAGLAHNTESDSPKVSLDDVIKTMWETARDMHENYKETSLGGLAKTVLLPEC